MALAFFRKRQKMVIIIMAALMISFLIGFQGFQMIFSGRRGDREIATTAIGPLTWTEVSHAARDDLEKLRRLGLGHSGGMRGMGRPTEMEYLWLSSNAANAPEAYALLLKEARQADVGVSEGEVTQFLNGLKPAGVTDEEFISDLTERGFAHERAVRELVARWLTVVKNYEAARTEVPTSEREIKAIYRDLNEKIDLAVVKLPAETCAPKAPTFTDKQIQEQLNSFREMEGASVSEKNPLGFGYRLKDRVKIDYLFISREVLQRVIRPREEQVISYYNEHRDEFIKREAVPDSRPASGPATSPASSSPATARAATEPAAEPKRYRSRQMTFSEAEPQIISKLSDTAVEQAVQDILTVVDVALERLGRDSAATEANIFDAVRGRMLSREGADKALAAPVKTAGIEQMPLDKAMAELADRARLDAICFPWGAQGRYRVDPKVKVTLAGAGAAAEMPLGRALAEVARQVFGLAGEGTTRPATSPATAATSPAEAVALTWQTCQGLPGVLFAGGTIDFLPIRTGRTDLLDRLALARHELLGLCFNSREGGASLMQLAFEAEAFRKDDQRDAGLLKKGYVGRAMYVTGLLPGRLVWRLTDAVASCPPEKITDDLRERIVKDLALKAGYEAARKQADEILAAAEKDGLRKAAEAAGLKVEETGLTARKRLYYPPWQFLAAARRFGHSGLDVLALAMMQKPVDFGWNAPEGLELDDAEKREELMKSAFALAPKDVEPKDGRYPAKPYALAVVPLPSKRLVAVVQRVDFRPVVAGEYETDGSRERIARNLADIREWEVRRSWFSADDIRRRLDYKAVPSPSR